MAAVVLNQDSGNDQLYATGVLSGTKGLITKGSVIGRDGNLVTLTLSGDVPAGSSAELTFQDVPALPLLPQQHIFTSPSASGGGDQEGVLQLFTYNNGGFVVELVNTEVPPRGAVGPPALVGTQAIWGMVSPAQSGIATIPLGAATIAVANTAITAGSVVMATGTGAADATATTFDVALTAGTGFAINANANATAAKQVSWFVVKY